MSRRTNVLLLATSVGLGVVGCVADPEDLADLDPQAAAAIAHGVERAASAIDINEPCLAIAEIDEVRSLVAEAVTVGHIPGDVAAEVERAASSVRLVLDCPDPDDEPDGDKGESSPGKDEGKESGEDNGKGKGKGRDRDDHRGQGHGTGRGGGQAGRP